MPTDLPHAFGMPPVSGVIKQLPEDFQVDEIPGFEPDGDGNHAYLVIRKTSLNTSDVVKKISQVSGVKQRDIGFAGMKDRHAVTTQTFSVNLSGLDEPDWHKIESANIQVLQVSRHKRKLKRGVLKGNRFTLRVRELKGDRSVLPERLEKIRDTGVPNYFGSQRFGFEGRNLQDVIKLFQGELKKISRHQRGLLLSSARSELFNRVLAERVRQGSWNRLIEGDVIALDGTERHFIEAIDKVLVKRALQQDVHPAGLLYGLPSRALQATGEARLIEDRILESDSVFRAGLEACGLEAARRPYRVAVRNLQWDFIDEDLSITFTLTSGAYATVVLREMLDVLDYTSRHGV